MNKKYYIDLLDRFFQGLSSEKENEILKTWIKNPEAKDVFNEYYQQSWLLAPDTMEKNLQNDILSDILDEIDNTSNTVKNKKRKNTRISLLRYIAVAASIAIIVGISAFFLGQKVSILDNNPVTMSVANGQKGDIILADGSHVYINSDSKITYNNTYNTTTRTLSLQGEAYFEVAKNKDLPFIVKANGLNIEALGTSFNVKAHQNSHSVSVILIEGSVRVGNENHEETLSPNERLEYNLITKAFEKSELHPNADLLLWRSKELVFYGESLVDICNTLTRMYDWKFVFKNEAIKYYTYTGIIKNNSLENVMDFISQSTAIRYEMIPTENTIILYK